MYNLDNYISDLKNFIKGEYHIHCKIDQLYDPLSGFKTYLKMCFSCIKLKNNNMFVD